jgi:hypothetical protein
MSKVSNNSNYNKVSVKADSAVKMIQELSKLGVFKEKRKPRAKKAVPAGDIRQEGDMGPGSTTPLGPQMRNLPPIQQIPQGATTQQIQDIQQQNAAALAQLSAEVQQRRISDIQNIGSVLFSIAGPQPKRFRSQQDPGAGVYNPMANLDPNVILLGNEPDVTETRLTQTINEGAPMAQAKLQETVFPVEETGNIPTAPVGLQPRGPIVEKTGGGSRDPRAAGIVKARDAKSMKLRLGLAPSINKYSTEEMKRYYLRLIEKTQDERKPELTNKNLYFAEINRILDELVLENL